MALSGKQSRRLDEVVGTMATAMHPLMMDLVREFSDTAMAEKFGKVWDVAELHAAEARVYSVTEKDVARELANRLVERLLTRSEERRVGKEGVSTSRCRG